MCQINILSKLDFSQRSAVQFGLKRHVKNTGILMTVYWHSVFCDIDPLYPGLEARMLHGESE